MKEVTETKGTSAAVPSMEAWGSETPLESNDIIIPKILLMQSDSQLVSDDKAKNKDFVNSSTKEVMKKISYVPFHCKKVFKISKKVGNKSEFVREEDWNAANDKRAKEFSEGGDQLFTQKIWRFYGLVNDESVPYVLDLRGMSFNTGKQLANQMYVTNRIEKKSPAGYSIELGTEVQEYDGAKKNVFVYKVGKTTGNEHQVKAYEWFKTIQSMSNVIVHQDESSEQENPVPNYTEYSDEIPF